MKRNLFFLIILVLCPWVVAGQATSGAYYLSGSVNDENGESLEALSVRVLTSKDSAYVTGGTTNAKGGYSISLAKAGTYLVELSYVGYESAYRTVIVSAMLPKAVLGTVQLKPDEFFLREVSVVGKVPEVVTKGDTIEFNADSYKTPPNGVVEDLLKRLPGVEIDSDGKIKANGKEVTKILVDGKEFFSGDTKVATKNLTADMVDKLQVIDSKSEMTKLTGIDDGDDEKVINLTIKKGMKQGWFGNASAGYGTEARYEASGFANRFVGESQYTILGRSNNNNNMGASDLGSGMYSRQRGGGMGFGGGSNGLNTSHMLGGNFNTGKGDGFRVGGDVRFSAAKQDNQERSDRQNILQDSVSYNYSDKSAITRSNDLSMNFRMNWEIDSFSSVDFRPSFGFNKSDEVQSGSSATLSGALDSINSGNTYSTSDAHGYNLSGRLIFTHKSKLKTGRQYSVGVNYSVNRSVDDGYNESENRFYQLGTTQTIKQDVDETSWGSSYGFNLSYIEPVFTNRFITFQYNYRFSTTNADKLAYDLTLASSPLDSAYSNRFRNEFMTQQFSLGFRTVREKYNYNVAFNVDPSRSKSINLIDPSRNVPARTVVNYSPSVDFTYVFDKMANLRLNYRGRTQQPSVSQLQPVTNVSNPLIITTGNPNLDPSYSNNFNARFSSYNSEKQRSIMAMLMGNYVLNSIVSKTTYDSETGVQTTMPVNVDGVWNVNGLLMLSAPFTNKRFTYSSETNASYLNNVGFNNGVRNNSGTFALTERLGLKYNSDLFDLGVKGNITYQNTQNSVQQNSNRQIYNYGTNANLAVYLPANLTLSTDVDYSGSFGYADGYDRNQWIWNAQLSYQFLKQKQATLALKVYDILQQRNTIRRTITGNYIQDSEYNTISSYGMLTFTYKFNIFSKSGNGANASDADQLRQSHDFMRGRGGDRPAGMTGGGAMM